MALIELTDTLHRQSGFTGPRLQAVAYAVAIGMSAYAGREHQVHFRRRYRETIEALDADSLGDVVGFIAARHGIKPAPVEVDRI